MMIVSYLRMILDPPCGYQAPDPARSKDAADSRVPDKNTPDNTDEQLMSR
jgi:hypothetical protein